MKINLNIFTLFVAFLSLGSCKQNQEKPGGYQGVNQVDSKKDKKNGEIDDLVADYESHDRLIWQKPDMVINRLGDLAIASDSRASFIAPDVRFDAPLLRQRWRGSWRVAGRSLSLAEPSGLTLRRIGVRIFSS